MFTTSKQSENQGTKPTSTNGSFFGSGGSMPFFKAALSVNQPGNALEREADSVADQVMRKKTGDAPIVQRMSLTPVSSVQRACANCEKEKEGVQRKETCGGDASGKTAPSIVSDVLSSGSGQPMDGGTRQFMESRFGQDFSQVRIHTDSRAAESANAIQARAYTSGRDVVFGSGEYQPGSESGQRLLAHELVHVGQQENGLKRMLQRQRRRGARRLTRAEQRQQIISNARRIAMHRVSVAYLRINGTSSDFNQRAALQTVRGLIAPDIVNFDQIVEIVSRILDRLSSDSRIEIGPEIAQCRGAMGWNAYVTGNRLPIHLCERFFSKTEEEQVRTLIHEAAHAAGFGEPGAETYFPIFDCSPSAQDNWNSADAWARYIHCISGQQPDPGERA